MGTMLGVGEACWVCGGTVPCGGEGCPGYWNLEPLAHCPRSYSPQQGQHFTLGWPSVHSFMLHWAVDSTGSP